jgi:hypothetical protein
MTEKKQRKTTRKAKTQTFGKGLVPIGLAIVAVSASIVAPLVLKMARALRDQRKAKRAAKRITLGKNTSTAREVKNHIVVAPAPEKHRLHQEGKKNGRRTRRNHLLKEASVRAKTIRGNEYGKFAHPHNSK